MKNKFFNISMALMLTVFALTSCTKDTEGLQSPAEDSSINNQTTLLVSEENVNVMNKGGLSSADIGRYHNIAVNLYFNNGGSSGATVEQIQDDIIKQMNSNYPSLMSGFSIDKNYNFISTYYSEKSISPSQKTNLVNQGLNKMITDKTISSNFASSIKDVTLKKDTYANKITQLNSIKASNNDEAYILDTYKAVLTNSNNLWNNGGQQSSRLKCSSGVIAADAVGAAVGLFGGPLWSIIQGAVVSIAVNEDC